MGKIVAICVSDRKGIQKSEIEKAVLIKNFGIEGDAHGGNWHRQVSLLDKSEIDKFNLKGGDVEYGDFGENLVVEGIDLKSISIGSQLKVGECIIEITQQGKMCHHHCQVYHRVGDCIMPREGVFGVVIRGGEIKKGDIVEIKERKVVLEACVGSFIEGKIAQEKGATRIELCENLEVGGTTPSYESIKKSKELKIPTLVMIRPRGGDFCYSRDEIEIMKEDIKKCKEIGVAGVVFGVLTKDKKIDFDNMRELVELAKPMSITFHKAIDEIENPLDEIENLERLGVDRILTSGKSDTALEGAELLNRMIEKCGEKLKIVVCGKVTKENIDEVKKKIPNMEYHGKKIV